MALRKEAQDGRYVPILFPNELIKRIDDFQFSNRLRSRADAVRVLIEQSLKQKPRKESA